MCPANGPRGVGGARRTAFGRSGAWGTCGAEALPSAWVRADGRVAVLSIGKLTVEQSRYYERQVAQGRDDYYTGRGESPGRWAGRAGEVLGLSGVVDEEGFMALMEGRHPGTGERLRRVGGRSKVAAFDLTFSAPKSVSVLFAVGDRVLGGALVEAHETAVGAALAYLEREACGVRRGRGGVRREAGEGFVAAAYRHRMSRAEDPQLHTHVVAANMARGADGRWTALDGTPIYQHAKAAGFLYQAHLRAAVRERLPWVRWGPVRNGMAEIEQIAPEVLREFSTRRRQIEERQRELVTAGVEVRRAGREAIAHDTRQRKRYGIDTAPWQEVVRARAAEHGLGARELETLARGPVHAPEAPDLRVVSRELAGASGLTERQNTFATREAVMAWAAAHGQGAAAVAVERAAAEFLTRTDVHRAPDATERRFTTSDLLAHEQAIVRGAQARRGEGAGTLDGALVDAVLASAPFAPTAEQAAVIRGLTSSGHGVESVEALAGTGKTFTAGLLAKAYSAGGFRVLGTAPTGRGVRELTEQAGIAQAWTLTRLALDLDADGSGFGRGPAVLILDEAGMASTRETARVMAHARVAGVKVIAIGDSGQLSSVQAGGWLGSLTRRLGSHELRDVMRQRDPRERQLLAQVRRGDPSDYITEKHRAGRLHIADDPQRAGAGERAAVAAWRDRQATCPWGQAVLIARDNDRRERLNALVRVELRRDGRLGQSVQVAGHEFAVGDRVIARRNDRLRAVDNGTRGTVVAVDVVEKDILVRTDAGAQCTLDAAYVTEHLQHAYALTAHTIQGGTVEWAGVVGHPDDFTRNWTYTALSRARQPTELFLIDAPTERELDRADSAPNQPAELGDERMPVERLEAAMRRRDDEDLALDRIDDIATQPSPDRTLRQASLATASELGRRSVDQLRTELAQLHERIGHYPEHLADQLRAARSARTEAQRSADEAAARVAELERPAGGLLRRRTGDPAALALESERLKLAEHHAAMAADRERDLAAQVPDPATWHAERRVLCERVAELETQLSVRRREHVHDALQRPGSYLVASLGELPDQLPARRTWRQAAQRIEAYRFEHTITDNQDALGPRPDAIPARTHWQQAQHDLHRAQHQLGLRVERSLGHDL
jgi:conjugative relaxase-like TrwC/TraI family protein